VLCVADGAQMSLQRGIDLKTLAEKMGQCSGAEVRGICTEAGECGVCGRGLSDAQQGCTRCGSDGST
jgi:ATP-dependent 26S proteasome regulatory subunit